MCGRQAMAAVPQIRVAVTGTPTASLPCPLAVPRNVAPNRGIWKNAPPPLSPPTAAERTTTKGKS